MELEYLKNMEIFCGTGKQFPAQHLKEKLHNMHAICINITFNTLISY